MFKWKCIVLVLSSVYIFQVVRNVVIMIIQLVKQKVLILETAYSKNTWEINVSINIIFEKMIIYYQNN